MVALAISVLVAYILMSRGGRRICGQSRSSDRDNSGENHPIYSLRTEANVFAGYTCLSEVIYSAPINKQVILGRMHRTSC